jgi:hypothetical protein
MNNMQQINNYDDYLKYLEKEKERVEKSKEQYMSRYQQPTVINQTFQSSPNGVAGLKHINSIEDVEKELTVVETAFVKNNYTQLFIKNAKGEIRTFDMFEVIPKDEKDEIIEQLRSENNKLKGMIKNESTNATNDEECDTTIDKPTKTKTTSNVSVSRTSKAKSK